MIPTKHKLKYAIHPNLPDISTGQLGLLCGKVKSGKGVLISNLLLNKNFYKDQFDQVYVISPTIYSVIKQVGSCVSSSQIRYSINTVIK